MPKGRPRKPMAVREANGRVHMSNEEKEARRRSEARVMCGEPAVCPPYLDTEKRRARFAEVAALLQATDEGLMTRLDEDMLGRYVLSEENYLRFNRLVCDLQDGEIGELQAAQRMQDVAFKQVQSCAGALGLSVSSRLKFDLPDPEPPKRNRFERFDK